MLIAKIMQSMSGNRNNKQTKRACKKQDPLIYFFVIFNFPTHPLPGYRLVVLNALERRRAMSGVTAKLDNKKVVFASSLAQRFEFLMPLRLKLISSRR